MNTAISTLLERIRELEVELTAELAKRNAELSFTLKNRRAIFEESIISRHRALKVHALRYLAESRPQVLLTAPLIYSLLLPFVLLDIFVSFYHLICFPIYGIPKVKRADHFFFDRSNLAYLNIIEKIHCGYCSYANGLCSYVREIAGRTEQYWCPIKHANRVMNSHSRYPNFFDYGDATEYAKRLEEVRSNFNN